MITGGIRSAALNLYSWEEQNKQNINTLFESQFFSGLKTIGMNLIVVEMAKWKHLKFLFFSKRGNQNQPCISGEIVDISVATPY